jgi:hypothetical protein
VITETYLLQYGWPVATTLTVGRVFEYDRRGCLRPVDVQVVATVEEEGRAVPSVKLDQVFSSDYAPRVARNGDHELEDDVVCQQIEEVIPVDKTLESPFDDPEERVQGAEVLNVSYQRLFAPAVG